MCQKEELQMKSMLFKILRLFFKVLLAFVAGLLLLASVYVAYNTPLTPKVRKLSKQELRTYTESLDAKLSEPLQFVADKFESHDVVLIGEMHWKKQDVDFVKKLIPYLYQTKGIKVFAWEFGASDFQNEVDSLVNAPEFDRKRAIALSRRTYFAWNFEEYLDIFRIIWEINQTIPSDQEKFRFLQLGSDYNPRKLHSKDPAIRMKEILRWAYDEKMGRIIEAEVIKKHKKALWYSGAHHAFTKYRQPLFLFLKAGDVRGGQYLYARYPERIYMILLHFPYLGRWTLFRFLVPSLLGRKLTYTYGFRAAFDQIYRDYKKPFAVDAKNPLFGDLKDNHSYYSFDKWRGLRLSEFCDGYVVPGAISEMEPVALVPDWVTNDAELEEVKSILPAEDAARIKDVPALLKYIEEETGWAQVKELRNLGEF
jgi:hypothetical protein